MRLLLFLLTLFIFSACQSSDLKSEVAIKSQHKLSEKQMISSSFFDSSRIKPIPIPENSFNRVNEWFDGETILYQTTLNGKTSLYRYHLLSGKNALFYETQVPIISVQANYDRTLFAIQKLNVGYEMELLIVDRKGNKVFQSTFLTSEFNFRWNPHNAGQLLVVCMLPNWEISGYILDVNHQSKKEIHLNNPFVHWYDHSNVMYLNWEEANGHSAPLVIQNINTGKVERLLDDGIVTFNVFPTVLLTVSEKEGTIDEALISFYNIEDLYKINELDFPILNTYSEHWWIPEHVYIPQNQQFYYMNPMFNQSGGVEGYYLTQFSLENGTSQDIISLRENTPLLCSPNGKWCLIGSKFEYIIDFEKKKRIQLITACNGCQIQ